MNDYLWVVEMFIAETMTWEATVGCGITRYSARIEKAELEHNNPCDRFRIKKYVRQERS